MWILLTQIPADRMQSAYYNGSKYAVNGKVVLVKLTKGIYGLPQAALLAKQRLDTLLATHGYLETPTLCLYKLVSRPIMLTLVVDDFGIKSHGQEHLDHLLNTLRTICTIKTGDATKYLGMTLEWDYIHRTVAK